MLDVSSEGRDSFHRRNTSEQLWPLPFRGFVLDIYDSPLYPFPIDHIEHKFRVELLSDGSVSIRLSAHDAGFASQPRSTFGSKTVA